MVYGVKWDGVIGASPPSEGLLARWVSPRELPEDG